MNPGLSTAAIEFLENYQRDALRRWAPQDWSARTEFVQIRLEGRRWLDWSTEEAALRFFQTELVANSLEPAEDREAIVLAGPLVELVDMPRLLNAALESLGAGASVVGLVPCLRDNSPESALFSELAQKTLWPYRAVEEMTEIIREAGWQLPSDLYRFAPVPQFNEAVLKDQLGFKGFRRIFDRLETEGYDPREVGWGELRFVAQSS